MSQSIYDASIPWFLQALGNLSNVLEKGSAHCDTMYPPLADISTTVCVPLATVRCCAHGPTPTIDVVYAPPSVQGEKKPHTPAQ